MLLDDVLDAPGSLFHNSETGLSGCSNPTCGWKGVATVVDGVISDECPACGPEMDRIEAELAREAEVAALKKTTGRNDPCPCGSGRKFKRCCLA